MCIIIIDNKNIMGNYFSTPNTESITIINEADHVHVVMSESQHTTNENKHAIEEKNILLKIYDKEELNHGSAATNDGSAATNHGSAATNHGSAATNDTNDTNVTNVTNAFTSTICKKKNVKKNKKNNKKTNRF
jgi:hypothetical protein